MEGMAHDIGLRYRVCGFYVVLNDTHAIVVVGSSLKARAFGMDDMHASILAC